ncbi:hypothetical protein OQA88_7473 [Cercophora sp. LCS_1]
MFPLLLFLAFVALATSNELSAPPALSKPFRHLLSRQTNNTVWPHGPFRTSGRDIVNALGDKVTWAGLVWPLHEETMLPEGLEYTSVDNLLARVSSLGFSQITLSLPVQLIDSLYPTTNTTNSTQQPTLSTSLVTTLGTENGTKLTNKIIAYNPIWTASTPNLKILTDITRIAAHHSILVHPVPYVGKAGWCCTHTDGSAWFADTSFSASNWTRALSYLAEWSKNHTNVVSIGLKHAPRESYALRSGYNWLNYVGNMSLAYDTVRRANPDLLVVWSGLSAGEDLSALTAGRNLNTADCYGCERVRDGLRREEVVFGAGNGTKLVWELSVETESETLDTGSCRVLEAQLYRNGLNALGIARPAGCNVTADCPAAKELRPVVLEGFGGKGVDRTKECVRQLTTRYGVSWTGWGLAGSFRVKEGVQGWEDERGLTSGNWTAWREPAQVEGFWKPWVAEMGISRP